MAAPTKALSLYAQLESVFQIDSKPSVFFQATLFTPSIVSAPRIDQPVKVLSLTCSPLKVMASMVPLASLTQPMPEESF